MAKKTETGSFIITKDLQDTVKNNPKIKEVYFDEQGNHSFHKHIVELHEVDDHNFSTKVTKVESMPGSRLGVVKIKYPTNNGVKIVDKRVNVAVNPVAITVTREEILAAQAVRNPRTEKEKIEILQAAKEIADAGEFENLFKKIKTTKE